MATSTKSSLNLICPCCGMKMRRRRWDYVCSDDKCGFVVKRTYHGHDFSDDELESLVNDGMQLELTDCTDKNGLAMPVKVSVDTSRKSKDGWAAEFYPHVHVECCLCGQEQFYEYPDYFQCRSCGLKIVKTLMKKSFSPAERLQLMEKGYLPKAGDFYRNDGTELQTAVKVDPVNKILMLDPAETGADECRRREAARLEQLTRQSAPESPAAVAEDRTHEPEVQSAPEITPEAPSAAPSESAAGSTKGEPSEKIVDLTSANDSENRNFSSGVIHHKAEAEPEKKEKTVDLTSSGETSRNFTSGVIHHKAEAEPEKKEKTVDLTYSNEGGSRNFSSGVIHHKAEAEPEKKEKTVDLTSSNDGSRSFSFSSGVIHHKAEDAPEAKSGTAASSASQPAAESSDSAGPKEVPFAASSSGSGSFLAGVSRKSKDDRPKGRVVTLCSAEGGSAVSKASFASGIKRLDSDSTLSARDSSKGDEGSAAETTVKPELGADPSAESTEQASEQPAASVEQKTETASSEQSDSGTECKRGGLLRGFFGRFIHKGKQNG